MGSRAVSSRIRNPAIAQPATTASMTMKDDSNQSARSPWSSVSWSAPKPTTMRAIPGQSTEVGLRTYGESKRNAPAMKKPRTPMGRLT